MTRPARVIINCAALRHNLSRVHTLAPGCKVMAVIKADAYGHGLVRVARVLIDADAFGVACLEEAMELRDAGITRPIVLLEGPYKQNELDIIGRLGLEIVVHNDNQLAMLEQYRQEQVFCVWIKVDSGMHRLGFSGQTIGDVWQRLQACQSVIQPLRLMTHLAAANERQNGMTDRQLQDFDHISSSFKVEKSVANSAGIIAWPASHADWVRPGLMLYGVSPLDDTLAADHDLQPVMTLSSELIAVKHLKQGEPVGYGARWKCPQDMLIGIVATGYGDGFPRHAKSGTPVLVNGQRTAIIGFASMDMLTVDLRSQPGAKVGDPVELWGKNLSIEEVAQHAETIPYELLCGVHKRLTFIEHG